MWFFNHKKDASSDIKYLVLKCQQSVTKDEAVIKFFIFHMTEHGGKLLFFYKLFSFPGMDVIIHFEQEPTYIIYIPNWDILIS